MENVIGRIVDVFTLNFHYFINSDSTRALVGPS
ncbi:hypothetical protein SAMN05444170_7418 [Bradyrhizobium erythrophlei]|uniref:Uncharacterized protein n=1 Tax=Bradyrhizobium erythrophlei TaxID=1437360 RepID=A0A1M7UY74_9BRAD|nr:hypothetical protein SAMN05444170_7418 [Bradyrhizobium erythrophlei]